MGDIAVPMIRTTTGLMETSWGYPVYRQAVLEWSNQNMALVHTIPKFNISSVKLVSTGSSNIPSSNSKSLRTPKLIECSDSLAGVDDGRGMDRGLTSIYFPHTIYSAGAFPRS
jgi:hypothetical protein